MKSFLCKLRWIFFHRFIRLVSATICVYLISGNQRECLAQLNESDSIRWQIKFNATASVLDGNVARTLLLNRIEVAHANKQ